MDLNSSAEDLLSCIQNAAIYLTKLSFQSKQHQESFEKLVDKSIIEEVSEDEAIGDEIDSFPELTLQMADEVYLEYELINVYNST